MQRFKYVSYYLELSVPLYQILVLLSELTLLIVIDITGRIFFTFHVILLLFHTYFYDFCWSDIYEGWYFTLQCLHLALFGNESSSF